MSINLLKMMLLGDSADISEVIEDTCLEIFILVTDKCLERIYKWACFFCQKVPHP